MIFIFDTLYLFCRGLDRLNRTNEEQKASLKRLIQTYETFESFHKNYQVFESLFNETRNIFIIQNKLDTLLKTSTKVLNSGLAFTQTKWTTLLKQLEDIPNRNDCNVKEHATFKAKALIKDISSLYEFWSQFVENPLKEIKPYRDQ